MKAVWTRREVILLPAMIVGLVVLAPFKQMLRFIELAQRGAHLIVQTYFPKPKMVLLDLSIPDSPKSDASAEVGIQLLRTLLGSK